MKVQKILLASSLALAGLFAGQAMAAGSSIGPYITGQLGQSHVSNTSATSGTFDRLDSNATSYRLGAGYQFHQYGAVELGYAHLGKFDGSIGGLGGSLDGTAWDINLVGLFPIYGDFSGRASVGVAHTRLSGQDSFGAAYGSKNSFTGGLGVDYKINKNVYATVDYRYYRNVADTGSYLNNYSIGLKYKF